jgi:hypothetical protein
MRLIHLAWLPTLLVACTDSPLPERLDEADVAIPGDCSTGTTEIQVSGTVVDRETQAPVAGANVDITEAWLGDRGFPKAGCRIGKATTGADGRFGPIMVRASADPTIVMLVTGAGRAPTIADRNVGCIFGCGNVDEWIAAPSADLATSWREDLYAGGMAGALNRGLVAYRFETTTRTPAPGVVPQRRMDLLDSELHLLEPGAEVRFLAADRTTLAPPEQTSTTGSGEILVGRKGNLQGYFDILGDGLGLHWTSVGVIVATGWIYIETSRTPD